MKLIVDENLAFAEEAFSQFGDVLLLPGREISEEHLVDCEALIVRSVTRVNKELLECSPVKFVGTATIGTDHIDLNYLKKKNISFSDAAGCNANAVKEYVFAALFNIIKKNNLKLNDISLGIFGVGNIGSKAADTAAALGMSVKLNDPPLKRKTGDKKYLDFDELLNSDIITLHVPLNTEGVDKTLHLFDHEKLSMMKDGAIIINTSRGEVIDNAALNEIAPQKNFTLVFDVWENEPLINKALLAKTFLGTPHVAGYSFEGKVNGTIMIYEALCNFLNEEMKWSPPYIQAENDHVEINHYLSTEDLLLKAVSHAYNIVRDDKDFKMIISKNENEAAAYFDLLRKNYPLRREFKNYTVKLPGKDEHNQKLLQELGFKVQ